MKDTLEIMKRQTRLGGNICNAYLVKDWGPKYAKNSKNSTVSKPPHHEGRIYADSSPKQNCGWQIRL